MVLLTPREGQHQPCPVPHQPDQSLLEGTLKSLMETDGRVCSGVWVLASLQPCRPRLTPTRATCGGAPQDPQPLVVIRLWVFFHME